ncbi:MAG: hypothetical protein RLZZ520_19 [Bacteroidota bacterium]
MKSKMKFLVIGVVCLLALVYVVVPAQKELVVKVPLPIERVMMEFEMMEKVDQWYTPKKQDGYALTIEKANPFEFIFVNTKADKTTPLHIVVSPDTTDSKLTKIVYRYEQSRLPIPGDDLAASVATSLNNLGEMLKTTTYVYGHNILTTTVTDSSFLFQTKVVAKVNETAETKMIFDELIAYAEKRNAGYNGVRIFYTQRVNNEEVALFASVGVNNYTPTGPEEKIQYKMMPYGKKLLILDYEGPYSKSKELFTVLEDYKRYNTMVSMAIPFVKYVSPGYGFADSQIVKVRVSYPVF